MSVGGAAATGLRAGAAAWLVVYTGVLRPVFHLERLRALLEARPELAVGALVLESLPAVVGVAWLLRALRPGSASADGPFAAAARWAVLLSMAGLLLPLHASTGDTALFELGFRVVNLVALALMLDGPLEPGR